MFNESMREHTTIKIGGPADVWFEAEDAEDLVNIVKWAFEHKIPWMVFGNGSNTLVRDGGIKGIIISLKKFDWIREEGSIDGNLKVQVGTGVLMQHLLNWTVEHSLSGIEVLAGIPGTVGGAVVMNAGTKEGQIADSVLDITVVDKSRLVTIEKSKLEFSYRKLKLSRGAIVTSVLFRFRPMERTQIESKINSIRQHRKDTQPLIWPSLGSVFKNPKDGSKAWRLIESSGLRGVRVGGARVSNEHANWIINEGSATARDVEILIRMIKERVKEDSDVTLETEVIVVGEECGERATGLSRASERGMGGNGEAARPSLSRPRSKIEDFAELG